MQRTWCAAAWLGLAVRVAGQAPIQVPFSSKTFGPDGPWQAVEIAVGTNNQTVNLLPGGWFETDILAASVCGGSGDCPAAAGGFYDTTTSSPSVPPGAIAKAGFIDQWNAGPELNKTGAGVLMFDQVSFTSTAGKDLVIPNTALSLVETSNTQLPNGTVFPTSLGFFALGSPTESTTYTLTNGSQATANLVPGLLANTSVIPSNSWGLHVGSAANGQAASLTLGGYDLSRVVGTVGSYKLGGTVGGEPVIDVVDLTLGVEGDGATPFNTSNVGSLYQTVRSLNTSEPMSLNPTVPYMQMPRGLCEAVAEYLPVTFNDALGLYLWNTNDPQFARIVSSPAYMAFNLSQFGRNPMQIKVPFSVLNLTLTAPLTTTPTPYFPCKPSYSTDARFYLGRTFLQAAYLGVNWAQDTFFLAQAPGPDAGAANTVAISSADKTIGSSNAALFAQSWASHWTTVTAAPTGPSPGAKAGIALGVIAAVALLAAAVWFGLRRRHAAAAARMQPALPPHPETQFAAAGSTKALISAPRPSDAFSPASSATPPQYPGPLPKYSGTPPQYPGAAPGAAPVPYPKGWYGAMGGAGDPARGAPDGGPGAAATGPPKGWYGEMEGDSAFAGPLATQPQRPVFVTRPPVEADGREVQDVPVRIGAEGAMVSPKSGARSRRSGWI